MFPNGERADEQVVLLDVRGYGAQGLPVDQHPVDGPVAGRRYVPVAPESQRIQQRRFARPAGTHQRQQFARPGRTAHCNRKTTTILK